MSQPRLAKTMSRWIQLSSPASFQLSKTTVSSDSGPSDPYLKTARGRALALSSKLPALPTRWSSGAGSAHVADPQAGRYERQHAKRSAAILHHVESRQRKRRRARSGPAFLQRARHPPRLEHYQVPRARPDPGPVPSRPDDVATGLENAKGSIR